MEVLITAGIIFHPEDLLSHPATVAAEQKQHPVTATTADGDGPTPQLVDLTFAGFKAQPVASWKSEHFSGA
ncbi:hypothetical protein RRG08_022374 [Elysia crispata]|uniref:Uncharacterized protein n=1 Tax=Elysia crispata TaxID=231223 RepID=A0AAE1D8A7_9GAST|nr:hypothetical protein RRG08_022374 [Elysia crispata]